MYLEYAPLELVDQMTEKPEVTPVESLINQTEEGSTIFVKNLNFTTDEEKLWFVFTETKIGKVKSVTIVGGEKSKGYGFVEMDSYESAKKVILEIQGIVVDDHAL